MKIINLTPHPINIYSNSQVNSNNPRRLYLLSNQSPVITILPSGKVVNVYMDYEEVSNFNNIPIYNNIITGIDHPFEEENTYYIVSALFKQKWLEFHNIKEEPKLLTVGQVIYNSEDNPRPIGCLGLVS